jgi:hypothetical protein
MSKPMYMPLWDKDSFAGASSDPPLNVHTGKLDAHPLEFQSADIYTRTFCITLFSTVLRTHACSNSFQLCSSFLTPSKLFLDHRQFTKCSM